MEGCGRMWQDDGGQGRTSKEVGGCGRTREDVGGCGQGWAKLVLIALERYSVELKRLTFNLR